jgi:hypothetical protein
MAPPRIDIPKEPGKPSPKAMAMTEVAIPKTVGGGWKYKMTSNVAQDSHEGFLKISQKGTSVIGSISTWDNTSGRVQGTFIENTLELERDTGLDTVQHYRLTMQGDKMTGVFWNTGKYQDSGTIEIFRPQ